MNASTIAGLATAASFRAASFWLGLLLITQSATLRLVNAGTTLHYQHLLPWPDLVLAEPFPAAIVGTQMLIVAVALLRRRRPVTDWFRRSLGWRRGTLLGLAVVLSSATLSADAGVYAGELISATLIQLAAIGNIGLAVAALPREAIERLTVVFTRILGAESDTSRPAIDRFAISCAAAVTAIAALLSFAVYERHPHVQDEVEYLYQARYFAEGMLAMPAPPVPEAFELFLLEVGPSGWFSVFPPGWPAALAAGQWFGVPWLVNPVLSGLNVLLAYLVVWHLYDRRTARLAALLLSASPWHVYLGMSFMPHQLSLTCLLSGMLGVLHARESGVWYSTWIAGAAVGFLSLVRPLDGFVIAALLGLWSLGLGGKRLEIPAIAGLLLSTALVAALTFPYNRYLTGDATTFPMMAYFDRHFGINTHAYGFGPERGMGWGIDPFPGHSPVDAIVNADLNATAINVELFGWATGSLVLVYFFGVGHAKNRRALRTGDWLCIALLAAIFTAYFFNYFSGGPDFGARYWFPMILPCVVLTVRGLQRLADSLPEQSGHATTRVTAGVLALSAAALLVFVPWRALDKYHHYLGMRPDLRRLSEEHAFGRSLVLIRGRQFPDYASAAIYNPLDLQADAPLYVHDRSSAIRTRLRDAYPDRPIWVVDGPTRTGAGYRVVGGPIDWGRLSEIIGPPEASASDR